MIVNVEIPDWFVAKLGLSKAELRHKVAEAMLAEAYRAGRIKDDELEEFARQIDEIQGRSAGFYCHADLFEKLLAQHGKEADED